MGPPPAVAPSSASPCPVHTTEGEHAVSTTQEQVERRHEHGCPRQVGTFGAFRLLFCETRPPLREGVALLGSPETVWLLALGLECSRSWSVGMVAVGVDTPPGVDTPSERGGVPTRGTSVRKLVSSTNSPNVE